jgi:hypothetical protein
VSRSARFAAALKPHCDIEGLQRARGPGGTWRFTASVSWGGSPYIEPGRQGSGTQDYHSGEARKSHDKDAQSLTSLDDPSSPPLVWHFDARAPSDLTEAYPSGHLLATRSAASAPPFLSREKADLSTRDLQSPSNFPSAPPRPTLFVIASHSNQHGGLFIITASKRHGVSDNINSTDRPSGEPNLVPLLSVPFLLAATWTKTGKETKCG